MPPDPAPDAFLKSSGLQDPLLILLLERAVTTDLNLETLLLNIRRQLLEHAEKGRLEDVLGAHGTPFLSALAQQCFLNEYVYFETDEEAEGVEALFESINSDLRKLGKLHAESLALLATYRPLWELPFTPQIFRWYEPSRQDFLYKIIRLQLINPLMERSLGADIPILTEIRDEISQAVRAQYEENPYPRWLHMDHHEPQPAGAFMTMLFPYLGGQRRKWPDAPRILVAGCGTGKHAISAAMRFEGSHVLAMDLSRQSLAYGLRMARELSVGNVEYVQGDILELPQLGRRFDVVECVGVLHHLSDPLRGWRILTDLLPSGGLMRVGLYSATARTAVVAAREYVEAAGLQPTRADIRRFRRDVMSMPTAEPVRQVTKMADFYTTSECRDLVFHIQQREFTLREIAECLDRLELEFLGFEFASDAPARSYVAQHPEDATATNLRNWEEFEARYPELFASMYQFWVVKR